MSNEAEEPQTGATTSEVTGITGSRELDALWLDHLRWFNEETARRSQNAASERSSLLGFTGVLIALVIPAVLGAQGPGRWVMFVALVVLSCSVGFLAWAARPLAIASADIEGHRGFFRQYKGATPPRGFLTGYMIEDLLKVRDDAGSPITQRDKVGQDRVRCFRIGLALVVVAVALLLIGTFVQLVE